MEYVTSCETCGYESRTKSLLSQAKGESPAEDLSDKFLELEVNLAVSSESLAMRELTSEGTKTSQGMARTV